MENENIEVVEELQQNEDINKNVVEDIQPLDYYDDRILSNMNIIINNQQIIIDNQESIISQNKTSNLFSGSILFIVCVFLIYYFIRNMIIIR